MRSTFFGIELAKRALQAQQRALDVTGHNVANANTPGFTRQEAILVTETPYPAPGLHLPWGAKQVGTGVDVAEIRRLRDSFIDLQVRHEAKALGYWEARQNTLEKIEVILNEPSDSGLRSVLEAFWQSLEELSKNPESLAVRSVVRQRGLALVETFNHLDRQLKELQDDLDNSVRVKVNEINSLGRQIADLNQQILKIEVTGARANDLRDRRDVLLDQLARIINIQAYEDDKGLVQVIIGGRPLVQGVHFYGLVTREDPASEAGYAGVYWETDGEPVQVEGGTLRGLMEMRGYTVGSEEVGFIPSIREQLDFLAITLVNEFNAIHGLVDLDNGVVAHGLSSGSYGINFFTFTDPNNKGAGTIAVNPVILEDLNKIAAATGFVVDQQPTEGYYELITIDGQQKYVVWETGDGSNALKLAQLKHELTMVLPGNEQATGTFEDYYRAVIGQLGVAGQEARRMVENQELLVSQLQNNRESVSGVSLDEEMVNMIRFQHAYSAAARMVTVIDEMLDRIINQMGLVGR